MFRLVLVRHGESEWNRENRFTGWTDVDLSAKGVEEAHEGGKQLKKEGFEFDVAYTSVLTRAIRTLDIVLYELGQSWLPVHKTWRLNERHYGALQGLNKAEMAVKFGEEQVKIWRRSYDVPPPELTKGDSRWPGHDRRYFGIQAKDLPLTESLKLTIDRFMPCWHDEIAPVIKSGKRMIIAAHGNSLRALVKYLDGISDADIVGLNIPTGVPLVYELDASLRPVSHRYLGDEEKIKAAISSVAAQGKAKQG